MANLRPTILQKENDAILHQRSFYGTPLPNGRWKYFDAALIDALFRNQTELEIWTDAYDKKITFGNAPRTANSVSVGYLTKDFYELLLKHDPGLATSFAPNRVNNGICVCFGRDGSDTFIIIDAYYGQSRRRRGGTGGENLTPCRIPAN